MHSKRLISSTRQRYLQSHATVKARSVKLLVKNTSVFSVS